ncbi:hypothetical protein PACTADRAFT_49242 [Pachysolen tannophilus NRRL Y-2460]|uniref:Uncharacterized protein n=1 Tax=Pachysolen tannophilus NRRL Y-2460 TaxID=669874 RepID=A0A1E4TVK0_PACTA|nr:hypothetical protein PACTADRAFT_49242 [Pachysolen tannophilus NRRL Y-2460]
MSASSRYNYYKVASEKLLYDDCFISKYKMFKCLAPSIPVIGGSNNSGNNVSRRRSCNDTIIHNVDYFSFDLTEQQLYKCWRIIHRSNSMTDIKRLNKLDNDKYNLYNRVEDIMLLIPSTSTKRLENASWRAWTKSKFHLKELDPASLNWCKENDITWLYGPLINDDEDEKGQEFELSGSGSRSKSESALASTSLSTSQQDLELQRLSSSDSLSSTTSSNSCGSFLSSSTSVSSDLLVPFHNSVSPVKPILKHKENILLGTDVNTITDRTRKLSFDELYNLDNGHCENQSKKRVSFNEVMEKREIIGNQIYDYDLQFVDNERIGYGNYQNI